MSSSRKVVELFYDVVSPYSWLGFEILCRYKTVWNIELQLRPAFLGGVIKESGNSSAALVPNKLLYARSDLKRLSQYFSVLLCFPENFHNAYAKGSLSAMRFLTAVSEKQNSGDVMFERVSRDLEKNITLCISVLCKAGLKAGLSATEVEELLQLSKCQLVKDRLKLTTEEAVKHMAFGFPLIVCHVDGKAETFFGSDRFEVMAHCIGKHRQLGSALQSVTSRQPSGAGLFK
uniref:Glutathione S-transferase kappa n=1 Tax=Astyanax mexicanus TaxID=7994 RepID=A0A8B9K482_ASTMX